MAWSCAHRSCEERWTSTWDSKQKQAEERRLRASARRRSASSNWFWDWQDLLRRHLQVGGISILPPDLISQPCLLAQNLQEIASNSHLSNLESYFRISSRRFSRWLLIRIDVQVGFGCRLPPLWLCSKSETLLHNFLYLAMTACQEYGLRINSDKIYNDFLYSSFLAVWKRGYCGKSIERLHSFRQWVIRAAASVHHLQNLERLPSAWCSKARLHPSCHSSVIPILPQSIQWDWVILRGG